MLDAERISECTNYLKQNEWSFSPMTNDIQEAITLSFLNGFETLQPDQKISIEHKLTGLSADIRMMDGTHPLRSILHDKVVVGIVDVLEIAGVVESARPGGLQRLRRELVDKEYLNSGTSLVGLTAAYLDERDKGFKKARRNTRRAEKKDTADELLTISSGIRFELARLGLVDERRIVSSEISPFESRSLLIMQSLIESKILREGLIGFTTLGQIIHKFWDTQRYARIAGAWD